MTAIYSTGAGERLTSTEIIERELAHAAGPPRVRVLCRCGFEAWGDTYHEASKVAYQHRYKAVGYPLTSVTVKQEGE